MKPTESKPKIPKGWRVVKRGATREGDKIWIRPFGFCWQAAGYLIRSSLPRRKVRNMTTDIEKLVMRSALAKMREALEYNKGGEVFFACHANGEMVVFEAFPMAFGNRSSVAMLPNVLSPGDIMIHNHPSGRLEPSSADVELSSECGKRGIGSYIVNNELTEIRVIIPASPKPQPLGDVDRVIAAIECGAERICNMIWNSRKGT